MAKEPIPNTPPVAAARTLPSETVVHTATAETTARTLPLDPSIGVTETFAADGLASVTLPHATIAGEEVRVAKDRADNPRSASIETVQVPITAFGEAILPRATRTTPALIGTSLPAKTRVLPSGIAIPAHPRAADAGEERVFTAATRTLRSKVLYDAGAPIPLTRTEYDIKRRSRAVDEISFEDGKRLPEPIVPSAE